MSKLGDVVEEALAEAVAEAQEKHERIVRPLLEKEERILGYQRGEVWPPFLLRIIPIVGDLVRKKKYLLFITSRRFLIVELTNPRIATRAPELKALTVSAPLESVTSIRPHTGVLTSSVTIEFADGQRHHFAHMLKSAAENLARDLTFVAAARRCAPGLQQAEARVVEAAAQPASIA